MGTVLRNPSDSRKIVPASREGAFAEDSELYHDAFRGYHRMGFILSYRPRRCVFTSRQIVRHRRVGTL